MCWPGWRAAQCDKKSATGCSTRSNAPFTIFDHPWWLRYTSSSCWIRRSRARHCSPVYSRISGGPHGHLSGTGADIDASHEYLVLYVWNALFLDRLVMVGESWNERFQQLSNVQVWYCSRVVGTMNLRKQLLLFWLWPSHQQLFRPVCASQVLTSPFLV